jgi:hypothetical protein
VKTEDQHQPKGANTMFRYKFKFADRPEAEVTASSFAAALFGAVALYEADEHKILSVVRTPIF